MQCAEELFNREGAGQASTAGCGLGDSVAHPLGDEEKRLVSIIGPERAVAEAEACHGVAKLYAIEARRASFKN